MELHCVMKQRSHGGSYHGSLVLYCGLSVESTDIYGCTEQADKEEFCGQNYFRNAVLIRAFKCLIPKKGKESSCFQTLHHDHLPPTPHFVVCYVGQYCVLG